MLPQALDSLLNLVYPQFCRACDAPVLRRADGVACARCWRRTRTLDERFTACAKCAAPLIERASKIVTFCRRCADHHYDAARAAGIYEHALAASLIFLKSEPFVPARLREMLADAFRRSPFYAADVVVPVPLSRRRAAERGYNQAELLARVVARTAGIPLDAGWLARTRRADEHRAALDRRGRELTVEKAFEVTRPNFVKDRAILLVDDVLTTGATLSSCAKELKKHGAAKVYALTAARAGGQV